jgi:hypothetical protein
LEVGTVQPDLAGGGDGKERADEARDLVPDHGRDLGEGSPDGPAEEPRASLDAVGGSANLLNGRGDAVWMGGDAVWMGGDTVWRNGGCRRRLRG